MQVPFIIPCMIQAYSMHSTGVFHACTMHGTNIFPACTVHSTCIFPVCNMHTFRLARVFCLTTHTVQVEI